MMQVRLYNELVTRNARGKVQVVFLELQFSNNVYTIKRSSGQHGGKFTEQPDIVIEKGKVKRSLIQQAELEYNSHLKKYLDKGYEKLSDYTESKIEDLSIEELSALVPDDKKDQKGNIKPMLAKAYDKCQVSVLNKPVYCSRKLDGVRCMMRYNEDRDEVVSISRGGEDYDIATSHLREIEALYDFLKENPNLILDGELYNHGMSLQQISGVCRLKTRDEERCRPIEYWIYDVYDSSDPKMEFEDRLDILIEMSEIADFQNVKEIKFVEHILLEGWESIKRTHDKWVKEGFEGLVARKPDKAYSPGKRGSDWIKVKDYQDDEFEITGWSPGLRDEDFVFTLKAKNGKTFEAKPMGTREQRADYLENIDDLVGMKATVKYFAISADGIPTQPIFKSIRGYGE